MVLETRLGVVILCLLFFLAGIINCSGRLSEAGDIAQQVGEFKVTITDAGQVCTLRYIGPLHKGSARLLPSPPCHFVLDWQGQVKTYRYEDLGPGLVVVVIGTPIQDREGAYRALAQRNDCGAQIQGIVFRNDGVFPLPKAHDAVRCADNGVDEREFWSLTH